MASKAEAADRAIDGLVERELAALQASTAADLIPGAAARRLVAAASFSLPYTDGKARIVIVGLAPGPPGNLRVPTQMESLRYTLIEQPDGSFQVAARPARADLITATERVLADEGDAMDTAERAFAAAAVPLPPGVASWRAGLRSVTYDARLPRDQFAGGPSWSFLFEDWNEQHGGWNMVLLSGGLGVEMVNGRVH